MVQDQNGELTVSSPVTLTVMGDDTAGDTVALATGWNLVGTRTQINVADTFSDSTRFTSVWKWQGGTWAVRLPGNGDGGAGYAENKGFALLSSIDPGDGFWVNSAQTTTVTFPGAPVADGPLSLVQGWNLVGLKAGTAQGCDTLVGTKAASMTSLCKWENGTWSVCLPGNGDNGQTDLLGHVFWEEEIVERLAATL